MTETSEGFKPDRKLAASLKVIEDIAKKPGNNFVAEEKGPDGKWRMRRYTPEEIATMTRESIKKDESSKEKEKEEEEQKKEGEIHYVGDPEVRRYDYYTVDVLKPSPTLKVMARKIHSTRGRIHGVLFDDGEMIFSENVDQHKTLKSLRNKDGEEHHVCEIEYFNEGEILNTLVIRGESSLSPHLINSLRFFLRSWPEEVTDTVVNQRVDFTTFTESIKQLRSLDNNQGNAELRYAQYQLKDEDEPRTFRCYKTPGGQPAPILKEMLRTADEYELHNIKGILTPNGDVIFTSDPQFHEGLATAAHIDLEQNPCVKFEYWPEDRKLNVVADQSINTQDMEVTLRFLAQSWPPGVGKSVKVNTVIQRADRWDTTTETLRDLKQRFRVLNQI